MIDWHKWSDSKPEPGMKVVIVCSDYCGSAPALIGNNGMPLHAEDGFELDESFVAGSIWCKLPDDWPLAFMNITDGDWF